MFTLLSSAITNTMEVLAPTVPADQHFEWHWNQIIQYYKKNDKTCLSGPIEATNICLHLEKMCRILCEEQTQESNGQTEDGMARPAIGPSMEYLLQHKVLETIAVLAQSDSPLGLTQQILVFFTTLLNHSNLELLPHKCVYNSVQKLIIICGKLMAGPYESTEMAFISCVCDQIQRNPDLINCFLNHSFPLINALLALLQSPDQDISTKSGDSLIKLLSVLNQRAQQIIAFETPFCSKIVDHLVTLYHGIPSSLKPEQIETSIECCFGTNLSENVTTFESFSPAIRKFLCFLRWFVFYDMIINHLPTNESILLKTLLNQLKTDFLESCICPDLLGIGYREESDAKEHIFLTTVLLSNCLRTIVSERLATTIGEFLLVDTKTDLLIDNQKYSETKNKLKCILLDRCLLIEHKSPESGPIELDSSLVIDNKRIQLCMSSMQLFEDILNKPSVCILNELVINYLLDRTYFDESVLTNHSNSEFSEFEDLRTQFSVDSEEVSIGSSSQFNYVSTSHVQRVLQYFISLVPDELKSCQTSDDLGYETYVREAQKHFQQMAVICNKWKDWSTETIISDIDSQEKETSEEFEINLINGNSEDKQNLRSKTFFEGPFLAMIFDNLEYMVRLPYEVNLQVTSLISKLVLIPHQNLNEYLLDPTIPLVKGTTRSLFTILHKLVDELQISVQGVDNLRDKLQITRKTLLGETDRTGDEVIVFNDEKTNRIIEALIVIEEFCKELAALSFVKYHNTF